MKFDKLKEDLKEEIKTSNDFIKVKIHPRGKYNNYFEIIKNPFGNCQIFSISWFDYFLRDCSEKEFIENLKYCTGLTTNKAILLIDISDATLLILKRYIKKSKYTLKDMIMFIKPYISTNGSKMNIVELNLKNTILKNE